MGYHKIIKSYNHHDYLNNVLPVLSSDIDEVTYVYRHDKDKESFKRNSKVIKKYKDIEIKYVYIKDINDLKTLIDEETIIDVSGVSYSNLLLFDYSAKLDNLIIYYNNEEDNIIDYRKHTIINDKLFKLSIEDIITLGNGEIMNNLHPLPPEDTSNLIIQLVNDEHHYYNKLINYINKVNKIVSDSNYHLSNYDVRSIIEDNQYAYISKYNLFNIENNIFKYKNDYIKSIFEASGTLLEAYTYLTLKNSNKFDEVMMSIRIDFSKKHNHRVLCELDGLAIKDNKLVFISCKSNKVDNLSLYEICGHNNVFGNNLSKACIVTANDLDNNNEFIYEKALELGAIVIDENNIKNNSIVDKILSYIKG